MKSINRKWTVVKIAELHMVKLFWLKTNRRIKFQKKSERWTTELQGNRTTSSKTELAQNIDKTEMIINKIWYGQKVSQGITFEKYLNG